MVSRSHAICSRWESYKTKIHLLDGLSGGRAMVFAPGLLHVYQPSRHRIPSLVRGGPQFIPSRGVHGVHSPSPPIAQLAEGSVARSWHTTALACRSAILIAWRLFFSPSRGSAKAAELKGQRTLHRYRCGRKPNRWARERKIENVSGYWWDGARSRGKLRSLSRRIGRDCRNKRNGSPRFRELIHRARATP